MTWNLTTLAKSDDDPRLSKSRQLAIQRNQAFVDTWRHRTDFLDNTTILAQALDDYQQLLLDNGLNTREWYYWQLRSAQDQLSPQIKASMAAADEVATRLANDVQFFALSLSKIGTTTQQNFLKDPALAKYKHFLQRLFVEGQFALSEPEEKILALTYTSSHDAWVSMTSTRLAHAGGDTLLPDKQTAHQTLPQLLSLISNSDKPVRDQAAVHVHRIMAENVDTATDELNAILGHKKVTDELRGLTRPDQARHLADDISADAVDALLSAVEQRFDIAQRFYQLKATLLGQPILAYHERNVEYGQIDQHYPYQQAIALVDQVFTQLDPQFGQIFQSFTDNGQIDVAPRQGKVGGAFCISPAINYPTFVLLNHTNRLQDVLTLAHEMGHAINAELMRHSQGPLTYDTPLSTAEVASTFMEDFVLQKVAADADKPAQLAINMLKLNGDVSSIFRQVAAYRFEQDLHQTYRQQSYLPASTIGQLFTQHMQRYMGPAVEQSPGSQNWWVYWSHFRTFFYVYSYASGLLISKSLQEMVTKDPASIAAVKEFLSAGTSQSPDQIFATLGIDINDATFWDRGLDNIEQLLQRTESIAHELKLV